MKTEKGQLDIIYDPRVQNSLDWDDLGISVIDVLEPIPGKKIGSDLGQDLQSEVTRSSIHSDKIFKADPKKNDFIRV